MDTVELNVTRSGNDQDILFQKEVTTVTDIPQPPEMAQATDIPGFDNQEEIRSFERQSGGGKHHRGKNRVQRNARESAGFDTTIENRNIETPTVVRGDFSDQSVGGQTFVRDVKEDIERSPEHHGGDAQMHQRRDMHIREGDRPHYEERQPIPSFQPVGTQWTPDTSYDQLHPEKHSPMAEFDHEKRRNEVGGGKVRRARPLGQYARDLVYWRNPRDSGLIFGSGLLLLLSLSYFSIISIFAYLSMTAMTLITGFVLFRQVSLAFQQQSGEHPFRHLLEKDVVISPDYAHQQLDNILKPLNRTLIRVRNVYFADSLGQTLKWAFFMYILTYIGSWFNLLTLLNLAWIGAFTIPVFYQTNKEQVDDVVHLMGDGFRDVRHQISSKVNEQLSKVRRAVPVNRLGQHRGQLRTRVISDERSFEAKADIDTSIGRADATLKLD